MSQPGWHPDPEGSGQLRWWDGQQWTSAVQPTPVAPTPPVAPEKTPQTPEQKRRNYIAAGVAAAVIVAFVGYSAWNDTRSDEPETRAASTTEPESTTVAPTTTVRPRPVAPSTALTAGIAEIACEKAIAQELKAPSTADFPDTNSRSTTGGSFDVRGVVDSENSFGGTVRSYFGCTVAPAGYDQHRVTINELTTS